MCLDRPSTLPIGNVLQMVSRHAKHRQTRREASNLAAKRDVCFRGGQAPINSPLESKALASHRFPACIRGLPGSEPWSVL